MALQITDANFQQILAEGKPLIIDFSATWCGPCKKISPIIDKLADTYAGRINVCKCDVDENDDLTGQFGVRNVPTVLFIKNGAEVDRTVGAVPESTFVAKADALL